MEFWGSEVKSGESIKVKPGARMLLHLSQASLGESKKDKSNELVNLFVHLDGKKHVIGTLSSDKIPQQQYDLVFEKDFELSHNWKNGSVYFFGYKADNVIEGEEYVGPDFESDTDSDESEYESDSEEDIPLLVPNNVKPEVKAKEEKPTDAKKSDQEKDSAPKKKKGKSEKVTPIIKSEDDDSDDSMADGDDDNITDEDEDASDSEDEDDSDDSEEETPVKVETGKKRASDSEPKTPAANKKVKLATPQKTDGKTGGSTHVATPHPSKQTEKKPKSGGGSHVCKSCSRTFGSESGLESHTKAKHSAGK